MNVLDRIYYNKETNVGLYERNEPDMPYVIKLGKQILGCCDCLADAYRFYNNIVARQQKAF